MLIQLLVALGCCSFAFGISHIFWIRRQKKHGNQAVPIFGERTAITFVLLILICRIANWTDDQINMFVIWIMIWYLLFLFGHTWYLHRTYSRNPKLPSPPKKDVK